MSHQAAAVSAPGKVLLAGGYLVLDRAHSGLVFALDARIHVIVQPIRTTNGVVLSEITVQSPQFQDAVWEYGYRLAERDGGINVTPLRVDADLTLNRNVFIETALSYALSYIATVSSDPRISPANITILADNDYYSTPAGLNPSATHPSTPRFHDFAVPLPQAHKTGLGSSAALVTAFTAALLTYYLPPSTFSLRSPKSQSILHNLSQAAHCSAQGKVGSGFDVASAVFGSCVYRRFSPSILLNQTEPGQPGFAHTLRDIVEGEAVVWDTEIRKDEVRVPTGLRLVLCDVSCGSQTPGMVKKVLQWRKEHPAEAGEIWGKLQGANTALATQLKAVAEEEEEQEKGEVGYEALRKAFAEIRSLIRLMSEKSGVPVEPPAQTRLLDACERVSGVLGGVVPGAGGYDAVALLIVDKAETVTALKSLLESWKFDADAETGVQGGGRVSMLGVRGEMQGVRQEDPEAYQKWLI